MNVHLEGNRYEKIENVTTEIRTESGNQFKAMVTYRFDGLGKTSEYCRIMLTYIKVRSK
ncbi:Putative RIP metalloprotease RseP [Leptospira santarosai]|uniref:RIP metalloprotease RseP n=1 Tax=Leptospira santarosai TaxID=28183 RepID=A0A2P1QRZ6_9LEPT|nr:Putative RIP metalloprotease RseP [Leptospira santarosai]